jgi:predicted transcriptional regulator
MARKKMKTSIALMPALIERLDRVARATRSSRSVVISDMIEAGLDQAEMMVKATSDPVLMRAVGQVMTDPGVMRQMIAGLRMELTDEQMQLFHDRLGAFETLAGAAPVAGGTIKKLRKSRAKR